MLERKFPGTLRRFVARAKPAFVAFAISLTSGKSRRTSSAVPSREALSTTQTLSGPLGACSRSERFRVREAARGRAVCVADARGALPGRTRDLRRSVLLLPFARHPERMRRIALLLQVCPRTGPTHPNRSAARSSQFGFRDWMRAIFFARVQPFNCFSRPIA